jgi:UPF0176 protein
MRTLLLRQTEDILTALENKPGFYPHIIVLPVCHVTIRMTKFARSSRRIGVRYCHMNTQPVVNIAAYCFATLHELPALRTTLRTLCVMHHLRGTILISPEGINIFVAGTRIATDALLHHVRQLPGCENIEVKESFSDEQPFNRMLVKIKREIIAFGVPGITPQKYSSRRLSPDELKRWLDDNKPFTLLDTRNDFEIRVGTFTKAVSAGIDDFRSFPSAIVKLPQEMRHQPVVTFCTGGIRCEKAAPLLEREGFTDVYQLDGGILKYFERCGSAHFTGECFVFDKRVALDATLTPGRLKQCYNCQAVLEPTDLQSPDYTEGKSCSHCAGNHQ